MSVHSRIDKTLDELLDILNVINYLGQNITFPKLAVAQARISGRAKGKEQGSIEMAELVCDRLIPDLETRANESLRLLGKEFVSTLGQSGIKGVMVRDKKTGLPIKIHPTIKEIFPDKGGPLYYQGRDISKKTRQRGAKLKQPEVIWSADAEKSVGPGMSQEVWEGGNERFLRYKTGELKSTKEKNKLLSKINKLPVQNILQDMRSKRSFHVHDWDKPNREFITNLRALPAPLP
jgi:hypothetical protein